VRKEETNEKLEEQVKEEREINHRGEEANHRGEEANGG
jgi:hypothetical protein